MAFGNELLKSLLSLLNGSEQLITHQSEGRSTDHESIAPPAPSFRTASVDEAHTFTCACTHSVFH